MASSAAPVHLRDDQLRAVEAPGGVVVTGSARSGKTTVALARWQRQVAGGLDPARILVLCHDAPRAQLARARLVRDLPSAGGAINVTSPWALAFEVLRRSEPRRRLAGRSRRRGLVAELVGGLPDEERGRLSPGGVTSALIDELADLALVARPASLPDAVASATACGHGDRWEVAASLLTRYHAALDADDLVDPATLVERAAAALDGERTYDVVIADDLDLERSGWGAHASLLAPLLSATSDYLIATGPSSALPVETASATALSLADPPSIARHRAIACHHPSIEGEAVAGVVLGALSDGRAPEEIVVICRAQRRARIVARALSRHGVPTWPPPAPSSDDPHVRGLLAMLRWTAGDDSAVAEVLSSPLSGLDTAGRRHGHPVDEPGPAMTRLIAARDRLQSMAGHVDVGRLAQEAFVSLARHLVPEPGPVTDAAAERSLDSCVAFVEEVIAEADLDPGLSLDGFLTGRGWDAPRAGGRSISRRTHPPGAVRIATPGDLRDHSWPVVVVCGAVEGELPRISAGIRYFDRALLEGGAVDGAAARRAKALDAERRLFHDVTARATTELVAIAPIEPGVLMSRFLADWPCTRATLPAVEAPALAPLPPTTNGIPLHPEGRLRLSASQLDTYAECPRRYLYEYPLRIRGDANVWADFGTLVHDILEAFIGRDAEETDLSWDRLVALAEDHWHDDIAQYRPQREELRRDLIDVLAKWWDAEGSQIGKTLEVLKAERSFSIEVAGHTITGRIDRVDRADDGVGIRILDYKTSKQPKPESEMDTDLQLRMYHLAALRDPELAALGSPTQLRLLFLRDMKPRDQEIRPDHEAVSVGLVEEMAARILEEGFEPRAGEHCRRCEVRRLCPLWPEGRESDVPT